MVIVNSRTKNNLLKIFLLGWLVAATCASSASAASSWWKSEWTARKKITLDTSAAGAGFTESVGSTPVLVRLFDGNFQFHCRAARRQRPAFCCRRWQNTAAVSHREIRLAAQRGVHLGEGARPEALAPTAIWLYYGNATGKAAKAEDAKGTYDENTALVYHFGEHAQPAYDFTMNGNNAKEPGVPADGAMIGTGLRLDGKATITIPTSSTLFWTEGGAMTWSAWIKFGVPQPHAVFFSRRNGNKYFLIGADNGVPFVEGNLSGRDCAQPRRHTRCGQFTGTISRWSPAVKRSLSMSTAKLYSTLSAPLPGTGWTDRVGRRWCRWPDGNGGQLYGRNG